MTLILRHLCVNQYSHDLLQNLKPGEACQYCRTCDKFIFGDEHEDPKESHSILKNINNEMLKHPIRNILKPVELNRKNAVIYLF